MNENEGYDFQGWEDPRPDYDVWEENEVARDLAAEHQAEAEALERRCIRENLEDDLRNVRDSLIEARMWLHDDGNVVKGYEAVKKALDYWRHVSENVGRLL